MTVKRPVKVKPLPGRLKKPPVIRPASVLSRGVRLRPRPPPSVVPPWRSPPPSWVGSLPEYACYWALTSKFKLQEGPDFERQASIAGGRGRIGGFVPDFRIYIPPVGINVDGLYVHTRGGTAQAANDLLATLLLAGQGVPLIHLLDIYLLENPIELVRQALLGIQPPGQRVAGT